MKVVVFFFSFSPAQIYHSLEIQQKSFRARDHVITQLRARAPSIERTTRSFRIRISVAAGAREDLGCLASPHELEEKLGSNGKEANGREAVSEVSLRWMCESSTSTPMDFTGRRDPAHVMTLTAQGDLT